MPQEEHICCFKIKMSIDLVFFFPSSSVLNNVIEIKLFLNFEALHLDFKFHCWFHWIRKLFSFSYFYCPRKNENRNEKKEKYKWEFIIYWLGFCGLIGPAVKVKENWIRKNVIDFIVEICSTLSTLLPWQSNIVN